MENIFKNTYFGKPYRTRNNGTAFYCRFDDEDQKHCLMVNDKENDFILCMENGHVFDIDELDKPIVGGKHNGKTAIELYGWNREELSNFRLDIVSEWEEEISEEELDELATNNTIDNLGYDFDSHDYTDHYGTNAYWAAYREGWKNGYRKAIEKYGSN